MCKESFQRRCWHGLSSIFVLLGISASAVESGSRFGFTGPEIFPIEHQIFGLQQADFDGDGRNDLMVVDNQHSKIRFLYNRSPKEIAAARKAPPKATARRNELPPDARFAADDLLMETRVGGVVVADFNADGRPDLVVLGDARRLQLIINEGRRRWREPVTLETTVSQAGMNAIAKGDLNADGLQDVVLLGDGFVEQWRQPPGGGLELSGRIPFAGQPRAVQVMDVDGDHRDDLVLVNWDDKRPLRVRLQDAAGFLGPEVQIEHPKFRAFEVGDLDQDGAPDWLMIAQTSGRAHRAQLKRTKAGGAYAEAPLRLLPLSRTATAQRGILWADLDGDQRSDLIYAESDQGLLRVLTQDAGGRFNEGRVFPSLTGIAEIARGDWDADGREELFVFSPEEKQVGVIRPGKNGQLPFPELFGLRGKPLAMAVGRFRAEDPLTVVVLVDEDGRRGLYLRTGGDEGRQIELPKSFRANPAKMFFHDVDQNGETDLVCLTPYEKIAVLTREGEEGFAVRDVFPPGGAVAQPAYGLADLDGDGKEELLLPQKNFVRAVVLEGESGSPTFRVKEQINGESGDSRIASIIAAPKSEKAGRRLYLLDAARNRWAILERNRDGVWDVLRELELAENDFAAMQLIDVDGPAVGFAGPNTVGWLAAADRGWEMDRGAGYDSAIEKGRLMDVEFGDLNNDGRTDVLFIESARHHLEIATLAKDGRLENAVWWQVFEERTFRSSGSGMPEPREAVIGDFTGDGKNDIALLVHDRVLLYPQE